MMFHGYSRGIGRTDAKPFGPMGPSKARELAAELGHEVREQPPGLVKATGVMITGNTYPVREQLKALGGVWSQARKAWFVPEARAQEAQALVGQAKRTGRPGRHCATCGQKINYGVYCGKCEFSR
jgi:hypothetical protein